MNRPLGRANKYKPDTKPKKAEEKPAYDLWADDGDKAVDRRPAATVKVSEEWFVDSENLPSKKGESRRRPNEGTNVKPNKRAAVAVPTGGQSYNPVDEEHQEALRRTTKVLERRKQEHLKFIRRTHLVGHKQGTYKGNLGVDKLQDDDDALMESNDANAKPSSSPNNRGRGRRAPLSAAKRPRDSDDDDEDEATSSPTKAAKKSAGDAVAAAAGNAPTDQSKKKANKPKKKKKLTRPEVRKNTARTRVNRRHPDRAAALDQVDDLAEIAEEVDEAVEASQMRQIMKRVERKEGQRIQHFGRHYVHTLAPDVLPSTELVGSLRHLNGHSATNPMLDRMKSLEERNLVPARVSHAHDQRTVLKPKGEVIIHREPMGILPTR